MLYFYIRVNAGTLIFIKEAAGFCLHSDICVYTTLFLSKDHYCVADCIGTTQVERQGRSEEHTSELQSLMRISYAVFCLKKKKKEKTKDTPKTRKPITPQEKELT